MELLESWVSQGCLSQNWDPALSHRPSTVLPPFLLEEPQVREEAKGWEECLERADETEGQEGRRRTKDRAANQEGKDLPFVYLLRSTARSQ